MEYICTICSRKKKRRPKLLPAIERYQSRRIRDVYYVSQILQKPFLILSGKFGFLLPTDLVPWYDELLTAEQVNRFVEKLITQAKEKKITDITWHAEPEIARGWGPYWQAIRMLCERTGIRRTEKIVSVP
ncbi:MAG: hypothetical protein HY536_00635 [Candidatus Colwellbacteria bacterium]|nr:hypothetical protein [Candidatus Colwellbacteria bacterium]